MSALVEIGEKREEASQNNKNNGENVSKKLWQNHIGMHITAAWILNVPQRPMFWSLEPRLQHYWYVVELWRGEA